MSCEANPVRKKGRWRGFLLGSVAGLVFGGGIAFFSYVRLAGELKTKLEEAAETFVVMTTDHESANVKIWLNFAKKFNEQEAGVDNSLGVYAKKVLLSQRNMLESTIKTYADLGWDTGDLEKLISDISPVLEKLPDPPPPPAPELDPGRRRRVVLPEY